MSAVPNDVTGAAIETRGEKVNRLVDKYARKASNNVVTSNTYSGSKNADIIAASMYALCVELGLVDIEDGDDE